MDETFDEQNIPIVEEKPQKIKEVSKSTYTFRSTLKEHLDILASKDSLFATFYANPAKNIDDCATYIINYVKNTGCEGFTDDEIFGQAVHYYEEDKIDIGKHINCDIVVNHKVELTPKEIEKARKKAIEKVQKENEKRLTTKKTRSVNKPIDIQPTLF